MSTNGTYINDKKLGKKNSAEIKSGDTIYLLHPQKIKRKKVIGFIITIMTDNKIELAKIKAQKEEITKL